MDAMLSTEHRDASAIVSAIIHRHSIRRPIVIHEDTHSIILYAMVRYYIDYNEATIRIYPYDHEDSIKVYMSDPDFIKIAHRTGNAVALRAWSRMAYGVAFFMLFPITILISIAIVIWWYLVSHAN